MGSLNHLSKQTFGTIETAKLKPMDRILIFKRALKILKIAIRHGFIALLSQKVIPYKPDLFVAYMNISCTGRINLFKTFLSFNCDFVNIKFYFSSLFFV